MDKGTKKTANPKCCLYWFLIEFIDWRYSQSCWYFQPLLWTVAPLSSLWPPPPTGRPLSKVLPCPNKGSRWWFLNFPQLRDISFSNIFNVHNPGKAWTESFFNLYTAHLWPSIFCGKFVFICIVLSYLTVDTAHRSLSGWCWWERNKLARDLGHKAFCLVWLVLNEESWKWFPILFFLFRNAHRLFTFHFCIPLYVY